MTIEPAEAPEADDPLRRQLAFARVLNELAEVIIASEDPQSLLERMAALVGAALGADRALIYRAELSIGRAVGLCEWLDPRDEGITSAFGTYPIDMFRGGIAEMLRTRSWIESHTDAVHSAFVADGSAQTLHVDMAVRSLLWYPFGFHEDGFHALIINQVTSRREWRSDEIAFLSAASRQVGLALDKLSLIAERSRVETELRAHDMRYRALYDGTPSMLFTVDAHGVVRNANRFASETLGYSRDELVGMPVERLYHEGFRASVAGFLRDCLARPGAVFRAEGRKISKNGKTCWVKETARASVGVDGAAEILIVCEDVTEQKEAEAAVLQAQKLETLGLLSASIAHDFNNLLSGVLANAELALMRLDDESPAREPMRHAMLGAQRSADLVKQLLAYSGKVQYDDEDVDVSAVVREMADLLRISAGPRTRLDLDLPDESLHVSADPTQLRQVIVNLVMNGAEAIDGGHGTVTVRVRGEASAASSAGGAVCVEVCDTGSGMDAETREKIFEPFFSTKAAGRGLGLASVQAIVRSLGGTVTVDSARGRGSTFRVVLPAVVPARKTYTSVPAAESSIRPVGRATVLVVDDDDPFRSILGDVLREIGCVPLLARGRADALELAHAHPEIACLLVDLSMPDGGGELVLDDLGRARPETPAIVMSGYVDAQVVARLARASVVGFLQKPFRATQLAEKLQEALRRSRRFTSGSARSS